MSVGQGPRRRRCLSAPSHEPGGLPRDFRSGETAVRTGSHDRKFRRGDKATLVGEAVSPAGPASAVEGEHDVRATITSADLATGADFVLNEATPTIWILLESIKSRLVAQGRKPKRPVGPAGDRGRASLLDRPASTNEGACSESAASRRRRPRAAARSRSPPRRRSGSLAEKVVVSDPRARLGLPVVYLGSVGGAQVVLVAAIDPCGGMQGMEADQAFGLAGDG